MPPKTLLKNKLLFMSFYTKTRFGIMTNVFHKLKLIDAQTVDKTVNGKKFCATTIQHYVSN